MQQLIMKIFFGLQHNQSGQTLIETLVAVFMLVMGVSASLGLAIYALNSSRSVSKQIIASGLAREGIEAVKDMRDTNWLQQNPINNNCFNYLTLDQTGDCYKSWLGNLGGTTPYCLNPSGGVSCGGGLQIAGYRLGFNATTTPQSPGNVVFDNAKDCGASGSTSLTCAFPVGSNPNRIMLVATRSVIPVINGMTYPVGGTPTNFTQIQSFTQGVTLWYLVNPDPGNNNLVINATGVGGFGVAAASYSGAASAGQPANSTATAVFCGNGTQCIGTIDTGNTNSWLVAGYSNQVQFTYSPSDDPGSRLRSTDGNGVGLYDKQTTAPGSYTISGKMIGNGTGNPMGIIVAEIKPMPPVVTVPNFWNFTKDATLPAYGNYGLLFDQTNSNSQGFYYSPNPNGVACADAGNMSDYCRKVIITLDFTAPYNHPVGSSPTYYDASDIGPLVKLQSQVWWIDKNCPRVSDYSLAPANCRLELDAYLTNWKDY